MHLSKAISQWLEEPAFKDHFSVLRWGHTSNFIMCQCGAIGGVQAKVYDAHVEFTSPNPHKIEAADPNFFEKLKVELLKSYRHSDRL